MAKEKGRKDTNNNLQNTTQITKDRATRTPLKTGSELRCSGRVHSPCSTSDTRRVTLVLKPVTSHELGKDREVLTVSGKYLWSLLNPDDEDINIVFCGWVFCQIANLAASIALKDRN